MIQFLFFVWMLSAIPVALFDIKKSLLVLISYRLLIPYSSFSFIFLEFNYVVLFVFLIFLFKTIKNKEKFSFVFAKPLIVFACVAFISGFFTSGIALQSQFNILRAFSIGNFLIPIMIWQLYSSDNEKDLELLIKVIFTCLFIMGGYGIYCFISKSNPYITFMTVIFQTQDNFSVFATTDRGGLIGRVQSTTFHPFLWSVLLFMILVISKLVFESYDKTKFYLFYVLMLVNLLVSGTRTGIFTFIFSILLIISFSSLRSKILFGLALFGLVLLGIDTSLFGKYQGTVDSILYFYDSSKSLNGSSVELRSLQLDGALKLWEQGGYIFGKGFGWCSDYYVKYGDHPVLLAFESLVYVALIDNGIVGILLWVYLFFYFIKMNYQIFVFYKRKCSYEFWLVNTFILSYILFCLITGYFGLNFFLIFLVLVFKKIIIKNNIVFNKYASRINGIQA